MIHEAKCYCREGYVRDKNGNCVSTKNCDSGTNLEKHILFLWSRWNKVLEEKPSCGVNEVYKTSGYDCATCRNYKNKKCYMVHEAKCYCKDGYVRNDYGVCVETSDCEKKEEESEEQECGRNEVFKTKGYDCKTCKNYEYVRCSLIKKSQCYCKQGYVRNNYGECVHTSECERGLLFKY